MLPTLGKHRDIVKVYTNFMVQSSVIKYERKYEFLIKIRFMAHNTLIKFGHKITTLVIKILQHYTFCNTVKYYVIVINKRL